MPEYSQKEEDARKRTCPLSMANSAGLQFCNGSDCNAWSQAGAVCIPVSAYNTLSFNLKKIGEYFIYAKAGIEKRARDSRPDNPQENGL